MARILILGGGFGGLAAAHELTQTLGNEHEITLLDRRDKFFVGFAKLWDMVGERALEEGSRSLSALDGKGVRFVRTEITSIDPKNRVVATSDGEFAADYLLVALGAAFSPGQISKFIPPAHNLYDAAALPDIRRALEDLEHGRVVVSVLGLPYKCPPAPYEASLMIDQYFRKSGRRDDVEIAVYTSQPSPLPVAGPEGSRMVSAALTERGIALQTEHKATAVQSGRLSFENGNETDFDLLLAIPAHVAPKVISESGLVAESGWIEPDRATLRTGFEGVYAVGDCTSIQIATGQLPKAGVFAEAEGRVAARNIAADISGGEEAAFDGHGFCFLDWADGTGSMVRGDFFAEPKPGVAVTPPSEKTIEEKRRFESERLSAWL